jgi:hypothetical protein
VVAVRVDILRTWGAAVLRPYGGGVERVYDTFRREKQVPQPQAAPFEAQGKQERILRVGMTGVWCRFMKTGTGVPCPYNGRAC